MFASYFLLCESKNQKVKKVEFSILAITNSNIVFLSFLSSLKPDDIYLSLFPSFFIDNHCLIGICLFFLFWLTVIVGNSDWTALSSKGDLGEVDFQLSLLYIFTLFYVLHLLTGQENRDLAKNRIFDIAPRKLCVYSAMLAQKSTVLISLCNNSERYTLIMMLMVIMVIW